MGDSEGVHRRNESRMFHQYFLSPLIVGTDREFTEGSLLQRIGNETVGLDIQ